MTFMLALLDIRREDQSMLAFSLIKCTKDKRLFLPLYLSAYERQIRYNYESYVGNIDRANSALFQYNLAYGTNLGHIQEYLGMQQVQRLLWN